MTEARIIDIDFVAIWNSGLRVTTSGIFYVQSGLVEAERALVEAPDCAHLEKELIVLPEGLQYTVCPICQQFILADVVEEDEDGWRLLRHNVCLWADCRAQRSA